MSFSAYPCYRKSGELWPASVPSGWEVVPLKRAASLLTAKAVQRIFPVALENIESRSGRLVETDADFSGDGTAFDTGDILYGKLRPYLAKVYVATTPGEAIGDFHVLRPHANTVPKYLAYLLLTDEGTAILNGSTHGAKMPRVSWEFLGSLRVPRPLVSEQTKIVAFVDCETAKIDTLVEEQRRLIELLKEKRQAVISHAVTKGLDPTVPMKDSGVEWLGEVPAHWQVTSVGRLCEQISYGFTNPMPTSEVGPFMLTANDIGDGHIRFETARRTTYDAFESLLTDKSRPQAGDVLVTKDGTLGRIAVFDGTTSCINQSVAFLRPSTDLISSVYLAAALADGVYQDRMIYEAGGTTIKHIYISRLAKMPIAIPPHDEMKQIEEFCVAHRAAAEQLARAADQAVSLLNERRAALISAAVTGKIDVRSEAPQQAQAA